jgi:hypothetical protein
VPLKWADAKKFAGYARYAKPDQARKFAEHMVPHVVRPAQIIWNKAIAAIFLLLAIYFYGYAVTHESNPAGLIGGLFLGSVMAFFAGTSFLRVRRLSRLTTYTKI